MVEQGIEEILAAPDRFQPVGGGVRISRSKRFPFYIFYRYYEEHHNVRILALMHQKRRPECWRDHL